MSKQYDPTKPFQKIPDASKTTGISQFALRRMIREGTAPYIRNGKTYLLNMRLLMQRLDKQSEMAVASVEGN